MARKKRRPIRKLGEIRQSQALMTFGVGSIVDFPDHSAMPLGLENWPEKKRCPLVHEPDLETMLEKKWFQAPPVADHDNLRPAMLPAGRFPQWLFCPRCSALGMVREVYSDQADTGAVFGPQFSFESVDGGKPRCLGSIKGRACPGAGVPTRLVVVCYHDKEGEEPEHHGHIDDFPWYSWVHNDPAHRGGKADQEHAAPAQAGDGPARADGGAGKGFHKLSLTSRGGSLAIDDLWVECSCGKKRSLRGVFGKGALKGITNCKGWRPWLETRKEAPGCDRPLKVFLRGATNLHIPVTESVISIPPVTDRLHDAMSDHLDDLRREWEVHVEDRAEENLAPDPEKFLTRRIRRLREEGFDRELEYADEQIADFIRHRITQAATGPVRQQRTTQRGRRFAECEILRQGNDDPSGDFHALPADPPAPWRSRIATLMKVHRLREVTALRGFRRISRDNPDADPAGLRYAPLSRARLSWLPAVELRGEGIFLELDLEQVRRWENSAPVRERMAPLERNFSRLVEREKWEDITVPPARLILVHTLAHLLIRQLTLECGYSSAALRERLYVGTDEMVRKGLAGGDMAGLLIYTSTTDSDGSLGGLVRMGEPERFLPVLHDALIHATWCSSDPVCCTTPGQGSEALNRAACHACALLPETSCERGNRYLDRCLVVAPRGTAQGLAFFPAGLLEGRQ